MRQPRQLMPQETPFYLDLLSPYNGIIPYGIILSTIHAPSNSLLLRKKHECYSHCRNGEITEENRKTWEIKNHYPHQHEGRNACGYTNIPPGKNPQCNDYFYNPERIEKPYFISDGDIKQEIRKVANPCVRIREC